MMMRERPQQGRIREAGAQGRRAESGAGGANPPGGTQKQPTHTEKGTTMSEWSVMHTVVQTIEAETAEEAERIARSALENADGPWWITVHDDGEAIPA